MKIIKYILMNLKINQIDLNDSEFESSIMDKINEEAKKLDDNINKSSLNYLNKYVNMSINELEKEIKQKNEKLLSLHKEKEDTKSELNSIIQNLNELMAVNSDLLCQKENDPEIIQKLEKLLGVRKRGLYSSKKINNTFKSQYKSMSERIDNLLSPDKIESFEIEIDSLKKDNNDINSKIKMLKNNNLENAKKIEELKDNKKFNSKIKTYSEEIKTLGNKKHEYYIKISTNKRSLDNILKEKNILLKLYNTNINKDSDEIIVSKINFWLDLIKSDWNGSYDEIIEKIETDNSKLIKEIEKRNLKNNSKSPLYLPPLNNNYERTRSSSPKDNNFNRYKNINNLNNINKNNISQAITNQYKGIFSKYSILKDKTNNVNITKYMQNHNEDNKVSDIDNDYECTNNNDYRELVNKKNEYVTTINRLEETIKEVQKTLSRKNKNISNTINDNFKKLNLLQQQNLLIKNEIENLEKVLFLTQEEMKIKKEIKINESKINNNNKSIQNVDPSVTANNILKDLNIINENINEDINEDDEEEERKKSIYQMNSNDLKDSKNDFTLEYNESNKKINFPNDISKVEKIDEEDIPLYKNNKNLTKEERLKEIKDKYLEIENEKQNDELKEINQNDNNEEKFENNTKWNKKKKKKKRKIHNFIIY